MLDVCERHVPGMVSYVLLLLFRIGFRPASEEFIRYSVNIVPQVGEWGPKERKFLEDVIITYCKINHSIRLVCDLWSLCCCRFTLADLDLQIRRGVGAVIQTLR